MDKAKLFQNDKNRAARLPKEYRFEGFDVYIRKFKYIVLLIPKESSWKVMESSIKYFIDYLLK